MKPVKIATIVIAVLIGAITLAVVTNHIIASRRPSSEISTAPEHFTANKAIAPQTGAGEKRGVNPMTRGPLPSMATPEARLIRPEAAGVQQAPSETTEDGMGGLTHPETPIETTPGEMMERQAREGGSYGGSQFPPQDTTKTTTLPPFTPITNTTGPVVAPPSAPAEPSAPQDEKAPPDSSDITSFTPRSSPGGPPADPNKQTKQLPPFTSTTNDTGPTANDSQ